MLLSLYLVELGVCASVAAMWHREQAVLELPKSDMADHVRRSLKSADIIPGVISDFKPAYKLNAAWSSDDFASLGNTLKPKNLQDAPSVSLTAPTSDALSCTSGETYVITVTDPDAPSRDNPKWSEMCHWIATGIFVIDSAEPSSSGCSLSGLADLKDVVPYKPPGPPPKTGKHRYVFLVFTSGNGTTEPLNVTKPDDRQHWGTGKEGHGVRDWARDNGLVPVAANFIYAQNKKQ